MIEFTGERVVPGHVSADLWGEHFARYAFARRFAAGKRVLDAGSGTGYGSAELAQVAARVAGIDLSPEAAGFAANTYPLPKCHFLAGSCERLPFPGGSFDLVVAFEVIEHLRGYREFLAEAARVLTPRGLLVVSTPNKSYYAETRAASGPNPYHEHEFEAEEFDRELRAAFAHVSLLVQNRVEAFAFHPVKTFWPADARIDGGGGSIQDAHFFIAVCSQAALPEMRSFAYVPKAANILREREQHVHLLEKQLDQTQEWLGQTRQDRDAVLKLFRAQKRELEERNRWADQLNQELETARSILLREEAAALAQAQGYEAKVRQLEDENEAKTKWALETEQRLTEELRRQTEKLYACVQLLDQAEATVNERTLWAQRTQAEREELAGILNAARASRWLRLGNRLGIGPVIQEP